MPKRVPGRTKRAPHFLRQWREHRHLTQEQLAERLETTKATISRIENGKQPYTQDFLEVCADKLGTDPASLIIRNPLDPNGMWSLWEKAKPAQRKQIFEVAKTLLKNAS